MTPIIQREGGRSGQASPLPADAVLAWLGRSTVGRSVVRGGGLYAVVRLTVSRAAARSCRCPVLNLYRRSVARFPILERLPYQKPDREHVGRRMGFCERLA